MDTLAKKGLYTKNNIEKTFSHKFTTTTCFTFFSTSINARLNPTVRLGVIQARYFQFLVLFLFVLTIFVHVDDGRFRERETLSTGFDQTLERKEPNGVPSQ